MAVVPTVPEGNGKTIEVPDSADCQANLSDIHISDARDSHSNTAPAYGMQVAEPEPQPNNKQLLQMLSTLRKQMEDQQTEMIRLHEAAAHKKDATTCVQIWLLKQIGTLWKSQSSPSTEENEQTPQSPPLISEKN